MYLRFVKNTNFWAVKNNLETAVLAFFKQKILLAILTLYEMTSVTKFVKKQNTNLLKVWKYSD